LTETVHTLRAGVGTVHRGSFDATLAPVLRVESGDVVELTTLSANAEELPPPGLGFAILPEHNAVLANVAPGEAYRTRDGHWLFDTAAGKDEVINRRVGEDELMAIGVCRAYVQAQREYAAEPNGRPVTARRWGTQSNSPLGRNQCSVSHGPKRGLGHTAAPSSDRIVSRSCFWNRLAKT